MNLIRKYSKRILMCPSRLVKIMRTYLQIKKKINKTHIDLRKNKMKMKIIISRKCLLFMRVIFK